MPLYLWCSSSGAEVLSTSDSLCSNCMPAVFCDVTVVGIIDLFYFNATLFCNVQVVVLKLWIRLFWNQTVLELVPSNATVVLLTDVLNALDSPCLALFYYVVIVRFVAVLSSPFLFLPD